MRLKMRLEPNFLRKARCIQSGLSGLTHAVTWDRLFKDGQLKQSDKPLSWWLVDKHLEDNFGFNFPSYS